MKFSALNHHDVFWCVRRLPNPVLKLMLRQGPLLTLAGGYLRSCIANEPIHDIDLFTTSKEVANSLARELANGSKVFETDNAYSVDLPNAPTVQFIHRWTFERPEAVVPSFDFTIARAAIWHEKTGDDAAWRSVCDERFYADMAAKRLVYCSPVRNEDAGGSILRVLKFYQRGYRIPLDSLGSVIARLYKGIDPKKTPLDSPEFEIAKVVTGLLREVDPSVAMNEVAYLPHMESETDHAHV